MKKNILLILGLIFVIAGVAVAYFAKFELADVTGFAITMFAETRHDKKDMACAACRCFCRSGCVPSRLRSVQQGNYGHSYFYRVWSCSDYRRSYCFRNTGEKRKAD